MMAKIPRVTLSDLLILLVLLLMPFDNFNPVPKLGKKPKKKRKPIPQRGGLPRNALWLRSIPATPEKIREANRRADENRARAIKEAPTIAAMGALSILKIEYKLEKVVWYDGARYVICDVWAPYLRVVCELDGEQHKKQRKYDREKDTMVRKMLGVEIIRDWNSWWTAPDLPGRLAGRLIEIDRLRRQGLT